MGEIADTYKEVYKTLDYGPLATARGFMAAIEAEQYFKPKSKVLCVGSGNSYEAVWLTLRGHDVYTLDYHHPKIKILEGKQIYGKGQNIPFDDKTFDFVLCAECAEHVPEKEINKFLSELLRAGKNQYCITVSDEDDPPYHTHLCIHGVEWWIRRLTKVGFNVAHTRIKPFFYLSYDKDDGSEGRFRASFMGGINFQLTRL